MALKLKKVMLCLTLLITTAQSAPTGIDEGDLKITRNHNGRCLRRPLNHNPKYAKLLRVWFRPESPRIFLWILGFCVP